MTSSFKRHMSLITDNNGKDYNVCVSVTQVGTIESDGKKSVRNLKGLRRDSEIIFVPNGSLSSTNSESSTCMWRLCFVLVLTVA
ncbi:hypothetical protein E2C01_075314 [Portunus trituberculatus]|uniref:Uncharacterized protein n=1 Tax=Portunus trituberculatus TaxID=210409 RepID=A0A5B7IFJ3_PORTR|nr:hypothetical protein [Portunus trituberculatus]